ncbi:MAG: hypothetical protein HYU75_24960, partial [Betaproteobacteria bacterium]|nr:hypothetical protein [Betaproteobacteria bacterium]
ADVAKDLALLEAARAAAETMLKDHPQAALRHQERWLGGRGEFLKA